MNGLTNSLYSVYRNKKTTKELWEALDYKYTAEDTSSKKFMMECFLDYKNVDSKTIISQVQEFQLILYEIQAEDMVLCELF